MLAVRHCIPVYLRAEPDRQRATALERFIVGRRVGDFVDRECRSAQTTQRSRWIHEMKPIPVRPTQPGNVSVKAALAIQHHPDQTACCEDFFFWSAKRLEGPLSLGATAPNGALCKVNFDAVTFGERCSE